MREISLEFNNYFIIEVNNKSELKEIKKNWSKILNIGREDKNRIIKSIKKNRNRVIKNWITIDEKKIIAVMEGHDEDIITAFKLILFENKKQRNEFLYDYLCNYLDQKFAENNYCDFKDNKCKAKRNTGVEVGCCRQYKNKIVGLFRKNNLITCEYLECRKCTAKCITCKMFTCDVIKEKFTVDNMILMKTFFNMIQRLIIMTSFFKTREEILRKINLF